MARKSNHYLKRRGERRSAQKTIAREVELGKRTTRDWLRKLEAQEYISHKRLSEEWRAQNGFGKMFPCT